MHRYISLLTAILLMVVTAGCTHYEDRIPPSAVRVAFPTVGDWNTYGISGAYSHTIFIKEERVPSHFPYTALSETGFGGILLTTDMHGAPHAFDLACPVELRRDVRIVVDPEKIEARCPVCGSTYDVFDNFGMPLSGPAKQHEYRLARYNVGPGGAGEYMLISR